MFTETEAYYRACAARGAAALDAHFGAKPWANRIDRSTLDIANPSRCVLAQLFGNEYRSPSYGYMRGRDLLVSVNAFASEYGFSGGEVALREAWLHEIEARLAPSVADELATAERAEPVRLWSRACARMVLRGSVGLVQSVYTGANARQREEHTDG